MRPTGERGYSALELLVASTVTGLILGGVAVMLQAVQLAHRDSQRRIDTQQSARLAIERMQRDLMLTGVGLTWIVPPFPLILPREDGGVDLRFNQGGITDFMTRRMSGRTRIWLNDVSGFEAGQQVVVYDSTGALDLGRIGSVEARQARLVLQEATSKDYDSADGAAVSVVQQVSYYIREIDGVRMLMRENDGDPPVPIAAGVVAFEVEFWDDSAPPEPFVPESLGDRMRIRMVGLTLTVEDTVDRLGGGDPPRFTLASRVTPRSIALSS